MENFKKELSSYETSKGAVQFPYDGSMPCELIKKITQFELNEVKNN